MGGALTLEGDAEYAAHLMSIMRSARFDLEAELRSLLGPILNSGLGLSLSQNVGQGVTDVISAGKQGLQSLLFGRPPRALSSAGLPDAEQAALSARPDGELADSEQTHVWMDEVDHAASALDRLEARLARLEQRRGEA
jgi:ubiquinone biosynthesis protein UbiJ